MPDIRDTETPAREPRARHPHPVLRVLRGLGWLVFFLVVASVTYLLLVLAGH